MTDHLKIANAFALPWNNLPTGPVYSPAQFEDWFAPLTRADVEDRRVPDLGCDNGSLRFHVADWNPAHFEGIDLSASVLSARRNIAMQANSNWAISQGRIAR